MIFDSEHSFKRWLQINGYEKDIIDTMSYKWDSISIVDGNIVDNDSNEPIAEVVDTPVTEEPTN